MHRFDPFKVVRLLGLWAGTVVFSVEVSAFRCFEVHGIDAPVYQLIPTNEALREGAVRGDLYFVGSDASRRAHGDEMREAGFVHAQKLLQRHQQSLPQTGAVLEVGPFLNPLGAELARPWVVWEYDHRAARELATTRRASVFRVDLNRLSRSDWSSFLHVNREINGSLMGRTDGFAGAVLSSVINYIDYKTVLPRVINEISDRGVLFIANSNVGDVTMMRNGKAIYASEILEFLFTHFGHRIEVLKGSQYYLHSFDGSRMGIALAVRVHRGERVGVDWYSKGLRMLVDAIHMPWAVATVLKYGNNKTDRTDALMSVWLSKERVLVEKHKREAQQNLSGLIDPPRNRQAQIELAEQATRALISRVLAAKKSADTHLLERTLRSPIVGQRFLPEREILLDALMMPQVVRAEFLRSNLTMLYQRLNYRSGLEWCRNDLARMLLVDR